MTMTSAWALDAITRGTIEHEVRQLMKRADRALHDHPETTDIIVESVHPGRVLTCHRRRSDPHAPAELICIDIVDALTTAGPRHRIAASALASGTADALRAHLARIETTQRRLRHAMLVDPGAVASADTLEVCTAQGLRTYLIVPTDRPPATAEQHLPPSAAAIPA